MTKPRPDQPGRWRKGSPRIEWDRERADRLQEEVEEYDATLTRQSDLLTRTVNALRGDPPPLTSWSHHDIPELAAEKVAEVARLTAERDALAQIKRHIDEVRNGTGWTVQIYGVLLQQCDQYGKTIDTRRAERAEAERDALAAQVARVEEVLDHWRTVDEGNAAYAERIGERSRFADGLASRADMLRAALAGPEANTSDVDVCSGDAYCTSALHVHGCFADTAGPCTDPDEHQPTDQDATGADQ